MTSTSVATTSAQPSAGRARLVLALVCASQFMVILDAAIVNVALPSVQQDLGFTASALAWVVNGYLLTFAGLMLLGGRAADLFGHRRMLVMGMTLFSAASLLGGLATTSEVLVAARVAQGAGAAMLAPATLAVVTTWFASAHDRARAFGAWSASGGVGGMAGAVAGGALTTGLSWRWVFLINVPIGLALILTAMLSLDRARAERRESLDLTGAATGTAGLAAVIYGIMQSADRGWGSAVVAGPILTGLVLLVAFVVVEARLAAHPMLPLRLFRVRSIVVGNLMLLLFGGIAIAMWYFTSLFLQNVLHYSALEAGVGQTPAAIAFVVVARTAASLLARAGARALMSVGCALFVAGFGWLAQAQPDASYLVDVLAPTLLIAVGIGLTFPTLMATVTADVAASDAGIIGGVASTASQVGGSVGLAALATAASSRATTTGGGSAANLADGYDLVFLLAAGLAMVIGVLTPLLRRSGAGPR